jgi:cystine transport system substrate-binding protein
MKKRHSLFLMAALPLALMTSVQAQSSLAEIQRAGVIKIGTEGTYPPFTYHDKSGKLVGFDVEIGELIASGLGVKPQFVEGKWDGLIAGVDAKRYDLVLNEVAITPERLKKYDFSDPYITSKAVIVVHSDNQSIKSFADLKGKKSSQSLTSNFAQLAKSSGAEVVATEGCHHQRQPLLPRLQETEAGRQIEGGGQRGQGGSICRPARQGATRVAGCHQSGAAQCQAGWRISENIAEIFRHRRLAIISWQYNNN